MKTSTHHAQTNVRSDFAAILEADTNVVSIPRSLNPDLVSRLHTLSRGDGFAHRAKLDVDALDVEALLVSIPDESDREFLRNDITELVQQLGALLGCRHLIAQLYTQRTDACRKIHSDNVSLRIMCTYAGPGTDWLAEADLLREHLGPSPLKAEVANRKVIRKGARLKRCEAGEVLLLKGETYPGNSGRGAAHRSPPLEADGATRLVLKIDQDLCGC